MLRIIDRFLAAMNLLSVLPPAIAVCWAQLLAARAGVAVPEYMLWLMGIIAWLIYVADRWLDALRAGGFPTGNRHRFYWRWRHALMLPWLGGAVAAVVLSLRLPPVMVEEGILLACSVTGYLYLVWRGLRRRTHPLLKELLLALLFSTGTAVTAFSLGFATFHLFLAGAGFTALCFFNLVQLTRWEIPPDMHAGVRKKALLVTALFVIICAVALALLSARPWPLLTGLFLLLFVSARRFGRASVDARAALADIALLLPALGWVLSR